MHHSFCEFQHESNIECKIDPPFRSFQMTWQLDAIWKKAAVVDDEYDIMYRVTDTWSHVARRLLIQTW